MSPATSPESRALASALPRRPFWTKLLTRPMQFGLDLGVLVLAFVASYMLRFELALPDNELHPMLVQAPMAILAELAALGVFGVYNFVWRYVGLAELSAFAKAAVVSVLLFVFLRFALPSDFAAWRIPISVIGFNAVLAFGGVVGIRVLRRLLYERFEKNRLATGARKKKPVLFVGAGRAGIMAVKEVMSRADMDLEVKGFIDDDPLKHGTIIHGVKVLGPSSALPALVKQHNVDHVVITIARATRGDMRRIIELCEEIPIKARVIPGLFEILDGKVEVNRIRDVQIDDLLGRDPVQLDELDVSAFLKDKCVLVTGAGGSIGSELCRQVARYHPRKLVLVEQAENALFLIDKELRESLEMAPVPVVADILDQTRMRAVLARHQPDIVFHAAAHKHVPMMEENPGEAVKNNVLGTMRLADVCHEAKVARFVMISTDKAVNPTSVMGATKRISEQYIQALSSQSQTRFVAVRFGNVLGSNGSVVPIFKEQIARGGPVTVTHPDMRRYFMTIPEASQLVLQAGTMGNGGEIFVLDMGEPVKIVDLARDVITLSGLRPGVDIQIEFTGLRPGEKLFEELAVDEEAVDKTRHPKIFVGRLRAVDLLKLRASLTDLAAHVDDGDPAGLLACMRALVPEYERDRADVRAANEQRPVAAVHVAAVT